MDWEALDSSDLADEAERHARAALDPPAAAPAGAGAGAVGLLAGEMKITALVEAAR